tara:strand:- start:20563 stop:29118 length:8556 start_codon:yes stop_codon:yes gene_type:complete
MGCGFQYAGKWYSGPTEIKEVIRKDLESSLRQEVSINDIQTAELEDILNGTSYADAVAKRVLSNRIADQNIVKEQIPTIVSDVMGEADVAVMDAIENGSPALEKDYSILDKALTHFAVKNVKDGETTRFSALETKQIQKTFRNRFMETILLMDGDVNSQTFQESSAQTIEGVIADMRSMVKSSRSKAKELRDMNSEDRTQIEKLDHYSEAIDYLLYNHRQDASDLYSIHTFAKAGIEEALTDLGMTKVPIEQTSEKDPEEVDRPDTQARESWIDTDHNLKTNPFSKMSTSMKAKMSVMLDYDVTADGEVSVAKDIFGNDEFVTNAYPVLASLFANTTTGSIEEKIQILEGLQASILNNPAAYSNMLFVKDFLTEMKMDGKVTMGDGSLSSIFTTQDLEMLNTTLNVDELRMSGLVAGNEESGALNTMDYRFTAAFSKVLNALKNRVISLKNTGGAGFITNLTNGGTVDSPVAVKNEDEAMSIIKTIGNTYPGESLVDLKLDDLSLAQLSQVSHFIAIRVSKIQTAVGAKAVRLSKKLSEDNQSILSVTHGDGSTESTTNLTSYGMEFIENLKYAKRLADEKMLYKFKDVLVQLDITIPNDFISMATATLSTGEELNIGNFTGRDAGGTMPLAQAITAFLSETDNMIQGVDKGRPGIQTILKWIVEKAKSFIPHTSIRVGTKSLSTLNNPIALNQEIKSIHTTAAQEKLSKDVYSGQSRILNILRGNTGQGIPWIKSIFQLPERVSIKSTYDSNIDKADKPDVHELNKLGTFLASIGASYKGKNRDHFGNAYNTLVDRIGNKEYKLAVRQAKIMTPTFSNKAGMYKMDSFDFDATDVNGRTKEEYLEYYIDSVVTPELNRAIALYGKSDELGIAGYNGSLVYSLPELNAGEGISPYIKELRLKGESLTSLFDENQVNPAIRSVKHIGAINGLRKAIKAAARKEAAKNNKLQLQVMKDTGMVMEHNGEFYLNPDLKKVNDFNNLLNKNTVASQDKKNDEIKQREMVARSLGVFKNATRTVKVNGKDTVQWSLTPPVVHGLLSLVSKDKRDARGVLAMKEELSKVASMEKQMSMKPGQLTPVLARKIGKAYELFADTETRIRTTYGKEGISDVDVIEGAIAAVKIVQVNKVIKTFSSTLLSTDNLIGEIGDIVGENINKNKTAASPTNKAIKNSNKINETTLNQLVGNYVFNTGFAIANMQQLMIGDMAGFYKSSKVPGATNVDHVYASMKNAGKRHAKNVSPGVISNGQTSQVIIMMEEPTRDSDVYLGPKKEGDTLKDGEYIKVEGMDVMDAAVYTTPASVVQTFLGEGAINTKEAKDILAYLNGTMKAETVNKNAGKDVLKLVSDLTRKPRIVGYRTVELENGRNVRTPVYVKMALNALTPNLAQSPGLRKMLKIMTDAEQATNKGLDPITNYRTWKAVNIATPSSVKIGGTQKMINLDDYADDSTEPYIVPSHSQFEVSNNYFAVQLRTDYKDDKKVTYSGQMQDILQSALKKGKTVEIDGKTVDVATEWARITNGLSEIGLDAVDVLFKVTDDADEFVRMITAEFIDLEKYKGVPTRRANDSVLSNLIKAAIKVQSEDDPNVTDPVKMKFLETVDGQFKHNITASPTFKYYLNILRSTIEKKTIKTKRAGNQLALKPDFQYDLRAVGGSKDGIIMFDTANIDQDTGQLRPQTIGQKAQILVPWDIKVRDEFGVEQVLDRDKYITKDDVTGKWSIDTNSLPQEVLNQLGYRTPTQDYSMTSAIEVVGFLPKEYKTTVVAPAEFTALMGSDFDIDKLFTYKYNLQMDSEGNVKRITQAFVDEFPEFKKMILDNDLNDLLLGILQDPDIVKGEVVAKLDGETHFEEFGDKLQVALGKNEKYEKQSFLSPSYQSEKFNQAALAGDAVGVWAKFQRIYSQFRRAGVQGHYTGQFGMQPHSINFGGTHFNTLAADDFNDPVEPGSNLGKLFRLPDVASSFDKVKTNISALLSVALDNETLLMLHKLNVTEDTYETISAFMMYGFGAKSAITMTSIPSADSLKAMVNKYNESLPEDSPDLIDFDKVGGSGFNMHLDGESRKTEEEFTDNLLEVIGDITNQGVVTREMMLNLLAINNLRKRAVNVFATTVSPFAPFVNMDSKGMPMDASQALEATYITTDKKYKQIWDKLATLPEMEAKAKALHRYTSLLKDFLSRDKDVGEVISIFGDSKIQGDTLGTIASMVSAKKARKFRPDIKSITERLDVLASSTDLDVIEYRNRNYFLTNIRNFKGQITLNKNTNVVPADIVKSLEELKEMGMMAGIDMAVLHEDLTRYAITTMDDSYGNSLKPYILPEYYPTDTEPLENVPAFAASVAFGFMAGVPTAEKANINYEGDSGYGVAIHKVLVDDEYVIKYNSVGDPDLKPEWKLMTRTDIEFIRSQGVPIDKILTNTGEKESNGFLPKQLGSSMERFFTKSGMIGYKNLMKAILGENAIDLVMNDEAQHFDPNRQRIALARFDDKDSITREEMSKVMIHESVHATLIDAVSLHAKGQLDNWAASGMDKAVVAELKKVMDSIMGSRKGINKALIENMTEDLAMKLGQQQQSDKLLVDYESLAFGAISSVGGNIVTAMYKLLKKEDMVAITGEAISPGAYASKMKPTQEERKSAIGNPEALADIAERDAFNSTKAKEMLLYAMLKNMHKLELLGSLERDSDRISFQAPDGTVANGYLSDKDGVEAQLGIFAAINKAYKDAGLSTLDAARNIAAFHSNPDNSEAINHGHGLVYGLASNQEFVAQSYAMGTVSAGAQPGFEYLHKYTAIADTPFEIANLYSSVINMLRKLVNAILGAKNSSYLWKDVVYAKVLVNSSKFVKPNMKTSNTDQSYDYTENGEDLLKIC